MNFVNNPMIWLILLVVMLVIEVVMLVIEVVTLGLSTIWFAGGALIAFLAALLGANIYIQVILFLVISIVLLVSTRPIAVRYLNGKTTATNVDSLIGSHAIVTSEINNLLGKGEAEVNGVPWSARSEQDDLVIEAGKVVEVVKIHGVKVVVREVKGE